ncbi:hypothetical protein BH20ACI3_BH20ACI3_41710 [soil metagenome]
MLLEWIIGAWYLAVNCQHCGTEFPFQRDEETPEATYFTDSNQIVLTCPECSYPLPYSAEEIKRVQAR